MKVDTVFFLIGVVLLIVVLPSISYDEKNSRNQEKSYLKNLTLRPYTNCQFNQKRFVGIICEMLFLSCSPTLLSKVESKSLVLHIFALPITSAGQIYYANINHSCVKNACSYALALCSTIP